MIRIDYLISFSLVLEDDHSWVKLIHIMDSSKFMLGYGSNGRSKSLYSLKEGQHKIYQIISSLEAMPGISDVMYVAMEHPYINQTIDDTRKFLYECGLDANSITDDELRAYFASHFSGESKYVMHPEAIPGGNGMSSAIISLQTDLLRDAAKQVDSRTSTRIESITTIGDVTIEKISFTEEVDAPEPPEAPTKRRQKGDK